MSSTETWESDDEEPDDEDSKTTSGGDKSSDSSDNKYVEKHSVVKISSRRKSNMIYGHLDAGFLSASSLFKGVSSSKKEKWRHSLNEKNGLGGEKPQIGMAIEICDPDGIWSSATIAKIKVEKQNLQTHVTVRYDGWGSEWDETCLWHDTTRLAKIFTFTKRFRCMVDLKTLTPASKLACTLWPCIVNFRMPDPTDILSQKIDAQNFLRSEQNIFVEPYGGNVGLLPNCLSLKKGNANNISGIWINVSRVKRWRDNLKNKNRQPLMDNFEKAYQIALRDQSTPNNLPLQVFQEGSLISAKYRPEITSQCNSDSSSSLSGKSDYLDSVLVPDTDTDSVTTYEDITASQAWKTIKPEFAPMLPEGVRILGQIYPGENVKKLEKIEKVCATVTMGGNDFVIGTYSTHYQAEAAIQAALRPSGEIIGPKRQKTVGINEEINAKILEMDAITLENIVASFHKNTSKLKPKFSIHEWAIQQLKYKEYLRKVATAQIIANQKTSVVDRNLGQVVDTKNPYKHRKRRLPRKVLHHKYESP